MRCLIYYKILLSLILLKLCKTDYLNLMQFQQLEKILRFKKENFNY